MVGDFNCVPDSGLDRLGASVSASPDAGITELERFTSAHLLADVWRHMHPCSTVYTWVRPNGEDASRIDRVYAPVSFTFSGCETLSCPLSDHDTVVARFAFHFPHRAGPMETLKPAFASTSQWWDDVKLRIKRYAIQYCVTRARRRREKFSKLCAEVKFGDPSAVIALQTYLDEKYHGARVRARVEAVEAEERPSLRFYQSVSSSAVTDASRLCALLMGPCESLSRLLERDSRLVPFVVPGGAKVKCAQYADDVTCVVSSLGSFRALSQDLSIFERATGAKLNPEKTKGLRLGSWRYRDLPFGASWSDQNIKINGIWFGYDAPGDVTWARGLRYLRAGSKPLAPAGFRS
ncbi:pol-like protein [Apostichopus japonicus]|uniref:Pol-like protein n=1 Tax=Stichopus japonicus TaxID=307972 RepID=A0A2G8LFP1_STIJA|nr:pol-like protein [Apostichopus japonicus]